MKVLAIASLALFSQTAFGQNFRCIAYNYQTMDRLKFDLERSKEQNSISFLGPGNSVIEKIQGIASHSKKGALGKYIFSQSDKELYLVSLETDFEGDTNRPEGDVVHVHQDTIQFYHTSCSKI